MKRFSAIILSVLAISGASAQSLTDAMRLGTTEIGGTARYRAMAGAFGAVGGDISCMGDNPAGIAVYRGTSELTITPHLSMANSKTSFNGVSNLETNRTQFALSNLGVVFSFKNDDWDKLVNFNLGLGFQRKGDVFRRYKSSISPSTRFDEYITSLANSEFNSPNFDGYLYEPLSLMGQPIDGGCHVFNTRVEDMLDGNGHKYEKVIAETFIPQGVGANQNLNVTESNRMDEYQISGSLNFDDTFYAGLTIGIIDMNSRVISTIDEKYQTGEYLNYESRLESRGSGVNLKLGFMFRPIDELRLGLAVHTPTWITVKESSYGRMYTETSANKPADYTDGSWEYNYRSPWEVQLSAATVLAKRLILSAEVDWRFMGSMRYSESRDYLLDGGDSFFDLVNNTIEDYTRTQTTLKLGAELRVNKEVSLRAGYAYITSPYKDEALNGTANRYDKQRYAEAQYDLYYGGTKVDYNTLGAQQYISAGLGYRPGKWGFDLTYIYRTREGKMAAYPANCVDVKTDILDLKTNTSTVDLTISYRFGK